MRVLLVSHRFPPDSLGGVERYTQMLAAELANRGDLVSIVTRRFGRTPSVPEMVREQPADGTMVYRFVGGELHPDRFLLHHERLEQLFLDAIIEAAPDVVHVNHLIGLAPRLVEIAHRLRVAVVLTLHDFYLACPLVHLQKTSGELCRGPAGGRECARTCFAHEGEDASLRWGLRTAYFRRLLATVERVITPSSYVATYFRAFGVDRSRLSVIPNGISIAPLVRPVRVCGSPRAGSTLSLGYIGSVARHKGVHVILEALALTGFDAVGLTILGETPDPIYARELRERAAAIPGVQLRLYGGYEPSELPFLLDEVDCVIVPSQVPESYSLTAREALAQGIPVIATRLGALVEAIVDGENGFLFDHRRPDELATLLRRLADDDALLGRLREGASRTGVVTVLEHARAVRTVYQEAVEELVRSDDDRRADQEELCFLHSTLPQLGLATPHGAADPPRRIDERGPPPPVS
jgi:glycosyltransferase involved in cell wall biosynthesis